MGGQNLQHILHKSVRHSLKTVGGVFVFVRFLLDFHNFVRPHEALDGKTPAEACGIKVEGENKRMILIQNASKKL